MASFEACKLILSQYFVVSKFYVRMDRIFHYLIVIWVIIINLGICGKPNDDLPICTICLQVLTGEYSIDAWENPFHSHHANEGIFCHSCSRIISQGITQGGVRYTDGRHLCSLCQASVVESDSTIYSAYTSVIEQFIAVGIHNIPHNIPIKLINLIELNSKCSQSHVDLKGFTHTAHKYKTQPNYTIFILFGLPQIEFEAVLAHELLHVWLDQNKIRLSPKKTEGFCNLGRYLIYQNNQSYFSKIHLKAMDNSKNSTYGIEYHKMKDKLEQIGWKILISDLRNNN